MSNVAFGSLLSTLRSSLVVANKALAARTVVVTEGARREHAFDAASGEVYDLGAHVAACVSCDVLCGELSAEIFALTVQVERAEDALHAEGERL